MTRYVVKRSLKVGERTLQPGDEIPEAGQWRNLRSYISGGYVAEVPEAEGGADVGRIEQLEAQVTALTDAMGAIADHVGLPEATVAIGSTDAAIEEGEPSDPEDTGDSTDDATDESADDQPGDDDPEPEARKDPLGDLSNEEYDALSSAEKGARTRKANEGKGK